MKKNSFFYLMPKIEYEDVQEIKDNIPVNIGTYMQGILGAIIGTFIILLPWIFCYVKFEALVYIFPVFTVYGALKGYQLFNGKVSKYVIPILIIVSYVTLFIVNIVVMPQLAAKYNNLNIQALYKSKAYMDDILVHIVASNLYAFLGLMFYFSDIDSFITSYGFQLNKRLAIIEECKGLETRLTLVDERLKPKSLEERDIVRDIFYRREAFEPQKAISKEVIMNNLYVKYGKKTFFKYRSRGVIKKADEKYYYCVKNEKFLKDRYSIFFVSVILFVICSVVFI